MRSSGFDYGYNYERPVMLDVDCIEDKPPCALNSQSKYSDIEWTHETFRHLIGDRPEDLPDSFPLTVRTAIDEALTQTPTGIENLGGTQKLMQRDAALFTFMEKSLSSLEPEEQILAVAALIHHVDNYSELFKQYSDHPLNGLVQQESIHYPNIEADDGFAIRLAKIMSAYREARNPEQLVQSLPIDVVILTHAVGLHYRLQTLAEQIEGQDDLDPNIITFMERHAYMDCEQLGHIISNRVYWNPSGIPDRYDRRLMEATLTQTPLVDTDSARDARQWLNKQYTIKRWIDRRGKLFALPSIGQNVWMSDDAYSDYTKTETGDLASILDRHNEHAKALEVATESNAFSHPDGFRRTFTFNKGTENSSSAFHSSRAYEGLLSIINTTNRLGLLGSLQKRLEYDQITLPTLMCAAESVKFDPMISDSLVMLMINQVETASIVIKTTVEALTNFSAFSHQIKTCFRELPDMDSRHARIGERELEQYLGGIRTAIHRRISEAVVGLSVLNDVGISEVNVFRDVGVQETITIDDYPSLMLGVCYLNEVLYAAVKTLRTGIEEKSIRQEPDDTVHTFTSRHDTPRTDDYELDAKFTIRPHATENSEARIMISVTFPGVWFEGDTILAMIENTCGEKGFDRQAFLKDNATGRAMRTMNIRLDLEKLDGRLCLDIGGTSRPHKTPLNNFLGVVTAFGAQELAKLANGHTPVATSIDNHVRESFTAEQADPERFAEFLRQITRALHYTQGQTYPDIDEAERIKRHRDVLQVRGKSLGKRVISGLRRGDWNAFEV